MPTTKKRRVTPISVIEEVVGSDLVEAYVSWRSPLSGQWQEGPVIVVIVDREQTSTLSTELSAEIDEQTGRYYPVFVHTPDETAQLVLPEDEVVPL
jgi:hypothetical protein